MVVVSTFQVVSGLSSRPGFLPRLPLNELPEQAIDLGVRQIDMLRIEGPFDLDDVVLVEAVDLDDRARRVTEHVGRVDDEPHGVAPSLGDQLHVREGLANARLVALDERVGLRIDAPHARDVDEVARAGAEIPGAGRFDGAGRRQRPEAFGESSCARAAAKLNNRMPMAADTNLNIFRLLKASRG
jgi:hypothetical protein